MGVVFVDFFVVGYGYLFDDLVGWYLVFVVGCGVVVGVD